MSHGSSDNDTPDDAPPPSMMSDWTEALRDVAPFLDLGWRIAASIALPPLAGYGVDVWLGSLPWGVLVGCALGLLGSGVLLAHLGPEMARRRRRHEDDSPSNETPRSDA